MTAGWQVSLKQGFSGVAVPKVRLLRTFASQPLIATYLPVYGVTASSSC
jgi:hypothetical protein